MKDLFEQAYFRYLNNLAYKSAMIECGVSAMMQGFETENVEMDARLKRENKTVAEKVGDIRKGLN